MPITVEQATVYRFKNRRFMSRSSAIRGAARMLMNERCQCEPDDPECGGGFTCRYHGGLDYGDKTEGYSFRLFNRLVRHLKYCDRKNRAV